MRVRRAEGTLLPLLLVLWAACGRGEGATVQGLPEGVTPEMVARGDSLFHGPAFCHTCHGGDGAGLPELGSDLTDDAWRHTDGSYEGLVERIRRGVSSEASSSGVPMPPRGGARLSDADVRAVAAYVWVLGRRGG